MTDTTDTITVYATATGLLIYIDHETKMAACINPSGLRVAHDRDLAVGCHAYASPTAWVAVAMLPTHTVADISPDDAPIVADWCEWCDDVFARHAEHSAEESIASSAQQVGVITDARFCDEVNVTLAREELAEVTANLSALGAIRQTTDYARMMHGAYHGARN